jgi:thiol-disulfide isomerase/thioredoxin
MVQLGRKLWLTLVALACIAGLVWLLGPSTTPQQGHVDRISLARAAGKPVLVAFGAGSCTACKEKKVILDEVRASHGDALTIVDVEYGSAEGKQMLRIYALKASRRRSFSTPRATRSCGTWVRSGWQRSR